MSIHSLPQEGRGIGLNSNVTQNFINMVSQTVGCIDEITSVQIKQQKFKSTKGINLFF